MRLPFFRSKNPDDPRAKPPRGGADVGAVQAARIRARRRLIGALVLLAVGVVGFPILFETQPRPLPVDTPILVPERTPVRVAPPVAARPAPVVPADAGNEPVAVASAAPVAAPVAASVAARGAASAATAVATSAAPPQPVTALKPEPKPEPKPEAKPEPKPQPKPQPKPEPEPPKPEVAQPAQPARPTAADPAASASGRFVVQVGAYNDPDRLRAARQNVEKLGYKTYTQEVDSPTGKRTRVRVGPFANRQEADAVATKVKASGMQANILAL